MIAILFIIMGALLLLGVPMVITLIAGPLVVIPLYFPHVNLQVLAQQWVGGIKPLALLAVPLFILGANIMTAGRSANTLLKFVSGFVRHIRGGLGITVAGSCTLFGAISGSTQATVAAIGVPLRPLLLKNGYSSAFSNALIINASDIALLIPPSTVMILYGVLSGTSIGELFIAGIGPGLLAFVVISMYCLIYAKVRKIPLEHKMSWKERLDVTKQAGLSFGYPVIIIGGIYSGIFSPLEAAAVGVLYAFLLEIVIYKSLHLRDLYHIALETGIVTAVVFILIGAGVAFSWAISYARIPSTVLAPLMGPGVSTIKILLISCIAYFIGCMFVDPVVVMIILTPLLHPIAINAGIDPVYFGILATLQVAIGSATPPFGCDIFTAIAVFRRPYFEIIKATPPFILLLLLVNGLLILFPSISLFLRDIAFAR